ncbi:hypothetical protein J0S82_017900, partial [Galemys pyrenaicus]
MPLLPTLLKLANHDLVTPLPRAGRVHRKCGFPQGLSTGRSFTGRWVGAHRHLLAPQERRSQRGASLLLGGWTWAALIARCGAAPERRPLTPSPHWAGRHARLQEPAALWASRHKGLVLDSPLLARWARRDGAACSSCGGAMWVIARVTGDPAGLLRDLRSTARVQSGTTGRGGTREVSRCLGRQILPPPLPQPSNPAYPPAGQAAHFAEMVAADRGNMGCRHRVQTPNLVNQEGDLALNGSAPSSLGLSKMAVGSRHPEALPTPMITWVASLCHLRPWATGSSPSAKLDGSHHPVSGLAKGWWGNGNAYANTLENSAANFGRMGPQAEGCCLSVCSLLSPCDESETGGTDTGGGRSDRDRGGRNREALLKRDQMKGADDFKPSRQTTLPSEQRPDFGTGGRRPDAEVPHSLPGDRRRGPSSQFRALRPTRRAFVYLLSRHLHGPVPDVDRNGPDHWCGKLRRRPHPRLRRPTEPLLLVAERESKPAGRRSGAAQAQSASPLGVYRWLGTEGKDEKEKEGHDSHMAFDISTFPKTIGQETANSQKREFQNSKEVSVWIVGHRSSAVAQDSAGSGLHQKQPCKLKRSFRFYSCILHGVFAVSDAKSGKTVANAISLNNCVVTTHPVPPAPVAPCGQKKVQQLQREGPNLPGTGPVAIPTCSDQGCGSMLCPPPDRRGSLEKWGMRLTTEMEFVYEGDHNCEQAVEHPQSQKASEHGQEQGLGTPSCGAAPILEAPVVFSEVLSSGHRGCTLDQGHLVGCSSLLRPVRTGPVTGPLTIEEQVAAAGILLHFEDLILCVVVVMEDEVACEEEDLGPHLTTLAHPLAMQPDEGERARTNRPTGPTVLTSSSESTNASSSSRKQPRGVSSYSRYLGILQGRLVAGRPVEHPLGCVSVDVSKEELLHQAVQVVLEVLFLHADQLQFVHGEIHGLGALTAILLPPQVIGHILLPGAPRRDEARARVVHQLAESLGHSFCVADDLDIVQLVVSFGAPTNDPGGLAQADLAPDDEGVGGACAAVATIIELVQRGSASRGKTPPTPKTRGNPARNGPAGDRRKNLGQGARDAGSLARGGISAAPPPPAPTPILLSGTLTVKQQGREQVSEQEAARPGHLQSSSLTFAHAEQPGSLAVPRPTPLEPPRRSGSVLPPAARRMRPGGGGAEWGNRDKRSGAGTRGRAAPPPAPEASGPGPRFRRPRRAPCPGDAAQGLRGAHSLGARSRPPRARPPRARPPRVRPPRVPPRPPPAPLGAAVAAAVAADASLHISRAQPAGPTGRGAGAGPGAGPELGAPGEGARGLERAQAPPPPSGPASSPFLRTPHPLQPSAPAPPRLPAGCDTRSHQPLLYTHLEESLTADSCQEEQETGNSGPIAAVSVCGGQGSEATGLCPGERHRAESGLLSSARSILELPLALASSITFLDLRRQMVSMLSFARDNYIDSCWFSEFCVLPAMAADGGKRKGLKQFLIWTNLCEPTLEGLEAWKEDCLTSSRGLPIGSVDEEKLLEAVGLGERRQEEEEDSIVYSPKWMEQMTSIWREKEKGISGSQFSLVYILTTLMPLMPVSEVTVVTLPWSQLLLSLPLTLGGHAQVGAPVLDTGINGWRHEDARTVRTARTSRPTNEGAAAAAEREEAAERNHPGPCSSAPILLLQLALVGRMAQCRRVQSPKKTAGGTERWQAMNIVESPIPRESESILGVGAVCGLWLRPQPEKAKKPDDSWCVTADAVSGSRLAWWACASGRTCVGHGINGRRHEDARTVRTARTSRPTNEGAAAAAEREAAERRWPGTWQAGVLGGWEAGSPPSPQRISPSRLLLLSLLLLLLSGLSGGHAQVGAPVLDTGINGWRHEDARTVRTVRTDRQNCKDLWTDRPDSSSSSRERRSSREDQGCDCHYLQAGRCVAAGREYRSKVRDGSGQTEVTRYVAGMGARGPGGWQAAQPLVHLTFSAASLSLLLLLPLLVGMRKWVHLNLDTGLYGWRQEDASSERTNASSKTNKKQREEAAERRHGATGKGSKLDHRLLFALAIGLFNISFLVHSQCRSFSSSLIVHCTYTQYCLPGSACPTPESFLKKGLPTDSNSQAATLREVPGLLEHSGEHVQVGVPELDTGLNGRRHEDARTNRTYSTDKQQREHQSATLEYTQGRVTIFCALCPGESVDSRRVSSSQAGSPVEAEGLGKTQSRKMLTEQPGMLSPMGNPDGGARPASGGHAQVGAPVLDTGLNGRRHEDARTVRTNRQNCEDRQYQQEKQQPRGQRVALTDNLRVFQDTLGLNKMKSALHCRILHTFIISKTGNCIGNGNSKPDTSAKVTPEITPSSDVLEYLPKEVRLGKCSDKGFGDSLQSVLTWLLGNQAGPLTKVGKPRTTSGEVYERWWPITSFAGRKGDELEEACNKGVAESTEWKKQRFRLAEKKGGRHREEGLKDTGILFHQGTQQQANLGHVEFSANTHSKLSASDGTLTAHKPKRTGQQCPRWYQEAPGLAA